MWYYVRNSQRIGPVDESTVATLVQNGTIVRQTPVWRDFSITSTNFTVGSALKTRSGRNSSIVGTRSWRGNR
jgi:hypothetical protein